MRTAADGDRRLALVQIECLERFEKVGRIRPALYAHLTADAVGADDLADLEILFLHRITSFVSGQWLVISDQGMIPCRLHDRAGGDCLYYSENRACFQHLFVLPCKVGDGTL